MEADIQKRKRLTFEDIERIYAEGKSFKIFDGYEDFYYIVTVDGYDGANNMWWLSLANKTFDWRWVIRLNDNYEFEEID